MAAGPEAEAVWWRCGLGRAAEALGAGLGLGLDLHPDPPAAALLLLLILLGGVGVVLLLGLGLRRLLGRASSSSSSSSSSSGRPAARPRKPPPTPDPSGTPGDPALLKALRHDDPKRKARRKPNDRPKPNGRPVLEVDDEVEVVQTTGKETLKQPLDAEKKNEKLKKNKKKSKADVKVAQDGSRHDGKEVDEGAWETKISNKEKRQQRKRDKGFPDTGSPDSSLPGTESAVSVSTEQLITATFPVGSRKNKGEPLLNTPNYKPGKGDSTLQQGLNENPTVNGGGWNEKSVKLSAQISAGEEKWTSVSPASSGKRKNEPPVWNQDTGDTGANGKDWCVSLVGRTWSDRTIFPGIAAWSGVDRRMNTSEQNSASFTSLGLNPAVSGSSGEPVSQPTASDFQWDLSRNQPHVDDEWSGLNGLTSADPSSDWNAPAEEWGNWVDEEKALHRKAQEPVPKVQKISDDKEKADVTLQSSTDGKSKKKKKKKKKEQGEDASSPAQDTEEVERNTRKNLQENTSKVKPPQEKPSKTKSPRDPAKTAEPPARAVSTEPSVILSVGNSDKISSQVPQKQEKNVSNSNVKQNSVPPSQTKSDSSWESPKQVKKKKKARRET
ncbi:protein LYRIC [Tachyglossus aculeatus]|uniref:protein LYRIC n=1 Tax=Tachyglossus aculeatus TaxID=9261 RepID=UPI0018F2F1AF|nr:protein LYRIC [Tachyglossus aculeatus]